MAVEVVGEGERGGKCAAFSTASEPVRRRRIVHKSTVVFPVLACQLVVPLGHQARRGA